MSKANVWPKRACAIGAMVLAAGTAAAQTRTRGPDVIVGELPNFSNYGQATVNSVAYSAFAVGTTSCNRGDTPLDWYDDFNETPGIPQSWWHRHPVIAQNLYRFKVVDGAGQFEMIGQSWLKHGFTALQGNACTLGCTPNPNGDRLGVGCSDPYSSSLNGSQGAGDLGPKSQVNPATGIFTFPVQYNAQMTIANLLSRRLVVPNTDLDPALNAGALYFVEGQYVAWDDAGYVNGPDEPLPVQGLKDNDNNNASYRRVSITFSTSQNRYNMALISGQGTVRERAAIHAWAASESGVIVSDVDVPNDGRFTYGYKVTQLPNNAGYHYEYNVFNMNSERAAQSFTVNYPGGETECIDPTAMGFKDANYHSGEIFDNTDWSVTESSSGITWAGPTFAQNPNGNALRWSTMYSFRFRSMQPPVMGTLSMNLFKPGDAGDPNTISFPGLVPDSCPPACDLDFNNDGLFPDTQDIDALLAVFGGSACPTASCDTIDFNGDGLFPDTQDIDDFLATFGGAPCP